MNLSDSYSDIILHQIGLKIKEMRIQKGFTSYEKFALEYELDRKQYWRVEKGTNLTIKTLIKILEFHKMSLSDFFQQIETEQQSSF